MLEYDADERAEKFILNQNLLFKYLDMKMQENAYRIMKTYARITSKIYATGAGCLRNTGRTKFHWPNGIAKI